MPINHTCKGKIRIMNHSRAYHVSTFLGGWKKSGEYPVIDGEEVVKSRLHIWKILVGFPVDLGKWKSTLFIAIFRYFVFILQPSTQHPIPISGRTRKQLWTTSLVEHSVTSIWWGLVLCFSEGLWELWWRWWSGANAVRTRTYIWQAVFSPSFLHSSVLHSVVC